MIYFILFDCVYKILLSYSFDVLRLLIMKTRNCAKFKVGHNDHFKELFVVLNFEID